MSDHWPVKDWTKSHPIDPATRRADPADAPLPGCSFGQAIGRFFGQYAKFSGRASRSEFWKIWIALFAMGTVGQLVSSGGLENAGTGTWLVVGTISLISLITLVPSLALTVRRLHDANHSGWWLLISVIPFGGFVPLIFCLMPSHPEGRRFDRGSLQFNGSP